ncbi:glycosyl transferase family 2 [Ornithinibacillus sp. L9]|uniref:Glycosyl transferase family 2 n=1 Tax=Ornithinibacillus caprae TaxID=2678566 RepID=A0A6N8FD94_9BACI|nr:glycosyl transferase family 2 [Ornithinibacillus caprae]MUK87355.1 glycosyl transferase family 2 [Ornithinibacillus caprae]
MLNNYQRYTVDYNQLEGFSLPVDDSPLVLVVIKGQVKFEFLIRLNQESEKAIVFGSGAYDATSELEPPIFQRHKWMKHFDENLIYYNDPTLYLGQINLGWGFGCQERHYLKEIALILEVLLNKAKLKRENTLFYGSSAGGFMSLMLAGFIKETVALVNNPQTIVWNYYDRHVNAMFNRAHPNLSREEIIEIYSNRLNVLSFYENINYVPKIIYLQNLASERDLTHHLTPFILGLGQMHLEDFFDRIKVELYYDKDLGHSPLRLKESVDYIKKTIDKM